MAATAIKNFISPSSQLKQTKNHFGLSNSPPYQLSAPSKPFSNPNIAARNRPFCPINAVTEETEIAEEGGDQDDEKDSISKKMEEINNFASSERLLNAAIVLGAGTLAITRLLTIDHDYWHGWTLYEVLRYAPEHNWIAYEEALKTHPVLSKMAISGIVYSLGDWIAQCYEGKPLFEFDRTRMLRSGLVGFTLHGSLSHYYYQFCEALFPFKDWWVVPAKVAFDQTVWSAVWNSIYYMVLGLLRNESPENILTELKATFWPLLTAGWKLWPFAHLITYGVVPVEQRLLWVDCVELIWVTILSTYSNEKSEERISEASEANPGNKPLPFMAAQMRKALSQPYSTAIAAVFKTSRPSIPSRNPNSVKFASSFTPLPPPEWVQPFTDLSDVIYADAKSDRQTSPWVPKVQQFLQNSNNFEQDLTAFCDKFLIRLPPTFVAYILKDTDRAETAFRFFKWAGKQKGYAHNLECFVYMIEILCLESDFDGVKSVFNEMKSKGFLMNSAAANSLIRSFGNGGMVEELLWVWKRMKDTQIEPSLYTYNFLMNGLVNCMYIESAERVLEVMEKGKVKPDVVTYNTMIKGYCKSGNVRKAIEKFQVMEVKNVDPDKITFLTLMQACYTEGDHDFCLRLYNEMQDKGLEIPPHAYSLVIGGLCREGKSMEGSVVFENMVAKGCQPNVAIYTALIDVYAKNRNLDMAMGLFERMQSEGFVPDEVTYGVIVNSLCKSGRLEEAMQWFEYCKRNNVAINAVLYSSLIDGLGKEGRLEEAEKLFEEMVVKGCPRDSYCYNVLIDALAKRGKMDEALSFFKKMEDEGCDQTVYTFTILINGLFKEHRNEEALEMWDLMIEKGITPTAASFRVLSTGLCLSGKVARACKILDELAPMGIVLDTAFEDMINVLCKAGRVVEACKLADGVIDRGREIPGRVRTVMINALRKAGNADLAIKLMHSKIGIGYDRFRSVKKRVKFRNLVDR
ncbi:Pentatricopeptide repeat superfamily protein [Perilla frutescens var. hirtella]|nr:Pentatricopeptide repeat superfamily protein [Perilla frutescens var. hirtella]